MKKRNRKIRSAMAAALAVSMVAAPCSSALAAIVILLISANAT
ncbi:Uncharacterised protein [uncultured Ruminococcus sp.]|nr:Uncharacterised protein [uncultured Ruminococcus sp.]